MQLRQALLLLIPCAILHSLGMDIFVSGIPEMMHALNSDEQSIQYLLVLFMVGSGLGQPFAGILCDKFGRRPIMLFSVFLFIITNITAGLFSSIFLLSLFRFVSGLAACGTLVATYAVVNDTFNGKQAYRMFSFIGCSLALAPMLAPILGVMLIIIFGGWQACFYFLGLFAALAFVLTFNYLPETKPEATIVPSLNSLKNSYSIILKNAHFLVYSFAAIVALTQLFLFFSVGNILLIQKYGISHYAFSLSFGLNALVFLLGNYFSTNLQNRLAVHRLVKLSAICMIIGALSMCYVSALLNQSPAAVVVTNAMMTFGVGLMMGPVTGAALQPFKDFAGVASGLFALIQYIGAALVGYTVTRFQIQSALSIALPVLILSAMMLFLLSMVIKSSKDAGEIDVRHPA